MVIDSRSLEGMNTSAKLIFLCGKMASGKSTLARDLAKRENAILLVQDEFLDALFPGEITDITGFVKCYSRLRARTTRLLSLVEGYLRRAGLRRQYKGSASVVPRDNRAN